MDITELILNDHHEQRRMFGFLDDIGSSDPRALAAVWSRLAILLEVHALAEERLFYPELLKVGTGGGEADNAASETKDAIKDHNEIRDAVREVRDHDAGTDEWWAAVLQARIANDEHMGEEERQGLADFRDNAPLPVRHALAVAFATFEAEHADGVDARDPHPDRYVDEHS